MDLNVILFLAVILLICTATFAILLNCAYVVYRRCFICECHTWKPNEWDDYSNVTKVHCIKCGAVHDLTKLDHFFERIDELCIGANKNKVNEIRKPIDWLEKLRR